MILDRAVEPEIIGSGCVLQPLESSHPADVEPSDNDQWTEFRPPEALDSGPPLDVTTDRRKGPGMVVRVIPQSPPTGPIWLRLSFRRQEGERFFGFGERSDRVERSGGVTEHWVGEGPYQLGEYSLMQAITPRWGMRRRLDATYFPVPWLLSSRGYGVLTENSEISYHVLDRQDQWSVHVRAAELCLRVFPAANPAEALRAFTEYSGRQPVPPASWHYGPWVQTGHSNEIPAEEEESHLAALAAAAVPIQAVETHLRYLPGGAHREVGRRQTERERTGRFKGRGLPSLSYLNPMVTEDFSDVFDQAAQAGAFLRHPDGSPYSFLAYVGGRNPPLAQEAQLDFTNPAGVKTFKDIAAELLEDGHVGWMEDFGEYTPVDSVAYDGTPGERMHNLYPVAFHRAGHRVASELAPNQAVARFARSGWAGAAPYVPIVWGGDPTTSWGFDGLSSAVIEALSMGLSGIAIWGTDIGGFFSLGDNALTIELLIRWIQFGAL
ncbi:MAG TPA: TIM-barrel domain-containing protein, partial [Candidatus Dormibacteraeota bacterium]|nr:TIM-barrel domain-containing protein [Candidatus Dormibacteraeota bacterium]